MDPVNARVAKAAAVAAVTLSIVGVNPGVSLATSRSLQVTSLIHGAELHHTFHPAGLSISKSESLSKPDDVTVWRGRFCRISERSRTTG